MRIISAAIISCVHWNSGTNKKAKSLTNLFDEVAAYLQTLAPFFMRSPLYLASTGITQFCLRPIVFQKVTALFAASFLVGLSAHSQTVLPTSSQEEAASIVTQQQENAENWRRQARAIVDGSTNVEDKVSEIQKWRKINPSEDRSTLLRVASGEKSHTTEIPGSITPSGPQPFAKDELMKEVFSFRSELGLQVRLIQMQRREPDAFIASLDELLGRASGAIADAQAVRSEIISREKDKQSRVVAEDVITTELQETHIDKAARETLAKLKNARASLRELSPEQVVTKQSKTMNTITEEMHTLRSKQITERKLR